MATVTEDHSGWDALEKEMNTTSVEVGWLDGQIHWTGKIPVAQLASHLHFYSPWKDTFMFSQTKTKQVDIIVQAALLKGMTFQGTAMYIGRQLEAKLKSNIEAVTTPSNDPKWAARKRNNKPLQYGSLTGDSPNLISTISSMVKR